MLPNYDNWKTDNPFDNAKADIDDLEYMLKKYEEEYNDNEDRLNDLAILEQMDNLETDERDEMQSLLLAQKELIEKIEEIGSEVQESNQVEDWLDDDTF